MNDEQIKSRLRMMSDDAVSFEKRIETIEQTLLDIKQLLYGGESQAAMAARVAQNERILERLQNEMRRLDRVTIVLQAALVVSVISQVVTMIVLFSP